MIDHCNGVDRGFPYDAFRNEEAAIERKCIVCRRCPVATRPRLLRGAPCRCSSPPAG